MPELDLAILQALPGQTTPEGVPAFKLVLVGDGGTGAATPHTRELQDLPHL